MLTEPLQIGMLIFPNMTNLDFAGPFELFSRLPQTTVHVLWQRIETLQTDVGGLVLPSCTLDACPALDIVFVGGGPGVNSLMEDAQILAFLAQQGRTARWVTSVCTGALVLGAAGLLNGYRATTHWAALDILRIFGAEPVRQRTVVDRNRITGGGITAGIDFGLTIAALLYGDTEAQFQQLMLEYDPQPPFTAGSITSAPVAVRTRAEQEVLALTAERQRIATRVMSKRN